jgi:putative FmdB family regulatory protein
MPIFEYRCEKCGKVFENLERGQGKQEKPCCPSCGEPNPKKVFSLFGSLGSSANPSAGSGCSHSHASFG